MPLSFLLLIPSLIGELIFRLAACVTLSLLTVDCVESFRFYFTIDKRTNEAG
jgi:hypothetical protein